MDKIDGFSEDELLVKILSFLPTKTAVSTSVLSKRWKYLWKRVSKLDYDNIDNTTYTSKMQFRLFVETNLPIERESESESLRSFRCNLFQPEDIKSCVEIAVSRGIRELNITYSSPRESNYFTILPDSLYTCKSLVTLKLIEHNVLLISLPKDNKVCLPSLKTLQLRRLNFSPTLQSFLSKCPVLENLIDEHDNLREISVPSLQRLEIKYSHVIRNVINTPSLKYFKVEYSYIVCYPGSITNMPNLEEVCIHVTFCDIKKFLQPITSVKRLSLRLSFGSAKRMYSDGIVFNHLEHLKLCTSNKFWSKLLFRFLQDSSKLRVIELYPNSRHSACRKAYQMIPWKTHVHAKYSATSLETFKWIGCEGRKRERRLVKYILNNAPCLKTATIILTDSRSDDPQKKLEMISKFKHPSFASTTCKLVFD